MAIDESYGLPTYQEMKEYIDTINPDPIRYSVAGNNGWYRIFTSFDSKVSAHTTAIILITSWWNQNSPDSHLLAICVKNDIASITQLSGVVSNSSNSSNWAVIDKVRVCATNNNSASGRWYVDIHYNSTSSNDIYTWSIGDGNSQTPVSISESIPSGEELLGELELKNGFCSNYINDLFDQYLASKGVSISNGEIHCTGGFFED